MRRFPPGRPVWTIAAKYQGFEGIHPLAGEFEASLLELKRVKALGMATIERGFSWRRVFHRASFALFNGVYSIGVGPSFRKR